MIPDSYLKALQVAFRQNIQDLYVANGYTFREINESIEGFEPVFQWRAYGPLWPNNNNIYGATAVQIKSFEESSNLTSRPFSDKYTLLCQLEIREKSNQGSEDFGLIYDQHEFLINHLNKSLRTEGITGNFENRQLQEAFLGLKIIKNFAGIDIQQQDLTKTKSLINIEWSYYL